MRICGLCLEWVIRHAPKNHGWIFKFTKIVMPKTPILCYVSDLIDPNGIRDSVPIHQRTKSGCNFWGGKFSVYTEKKGRTQLQTTRGMPQEVQNN